MNLNEQRERYKSDPVFHSLVNLLLNFLMEGNFSIYELKDAINLASMMIAEREIHPIIRLNLEDNIKITEGKKILSLEKQVVSLDIARRLKELGFPQDTLWYWVYESGKFVLYENKKFWGNCNSLEEWQRTPEYCSAPTVAELLNILPDRVGKYDFYFTKAIMSEQEHYSVCYSFNDDTPEFITELSPCDALAKFWIYLKENNMI